MNGLLPREPPVETAADEPLVVDIDDGDGDVLPVLASENARSILASLYDGPATKSDLADRTDSSIQTVDYHLENLADAGLVEVVDQWYSVKGREMDVYAPAGAPLVLVAGGDDHADAARRAAGDAHRTARDAREGDDSPPDRVPTDTPPDRVPSDATPDRGPSDATPDRGPADATPATTD